MNVPRVTIEAGAWHNRDIDGIAGPNMDRFAMLRLRYNLYRGSADAERVRETEARIDEALANSASALSRWNAMRVRRGTGSLRIASGCLSSRSMRARAQMWPKPIVCNFNLDSGACSMCSMRRTSVLTRRAATSPDARSSPQANSACSRASGVCLRRLIFPDAATAVAAGIKIECADSESDDPLAGCLAVAARLHGQPVSAEALTAGLPLEDGRLTPALARRAAERAGLAARVVKAPLWTQSSRLAAGNSAHEDRGACVLVATQDDDAQTVLAGVAGCAARSARSRS